MSLAKKRMVYPERLDLDSLMKRTATSVSPVGSWCETSSPSDNVSLSAPHPGVSVLTIDSCDEDDFPMHDDPVLRSCSSLNTWDQRSFGHSTPIKTIYQPTVGYNSYFPHDEDSESFIQRRIRELVQLFRDRTQKFRRRLELPPTPSTIRSEPGVLESAPPPLSERTELAVTKETPLSRWARFKNWRLPPFIVDPHGYWYVSWLLVVTSSFLYNACVIPLRAAFPYQTPGNSATWLAADYAADFLYLVDLVAVKPRLKFIDEGFWVEDKQLIRNNYFRKLQFKMDLLSLLPLDLLYLKYGTNHIALRLPRLLKMQSFGELYGRLDSMLPSPYTVRVARTIIYMLYMIHCNACAFYAFSAWEGIASNGWVFNGVGNAYIRCFFFATKTGISIGKNPKPETNSELVFMTWNWLQGVFVFALLISQMRDIVASATGVQNEYRKIVDGTLEYTRRMNLPVDLQERVKLWFTFTWAQQRTLDERQITGHLPDKLKTDVAISVHIQTLNKVQLFKDCDEALLRELVLKLRPVIFLPGDAVIRKGEVGKEMYIVKTGQVQVMGGPDSNMVLATLSEGSVFGEIALLSMAEGNRRTATVRSKGYSNVFVLSKDDLNEAIEHYPAAQKILKEKAQSLMKENSSRKKDEKVEETESNNLIFGNSTPMTTPKLVHTVLQVVPADSGAARLLKYGSRSRQASLHKRRNRSGRNVSAIPASAPNLNVTDAVRFDGSSDLSSAAEQRINMSRNAEIIVKSSSDEDAAFECDVVVHNREEYGK